MRFVPFHTRETSLQYVIRDTISNKWTWKDCNIVLMVYTKKSTFQNGPTLLNRSRGLETFGRQRSSSQIHQSHFGPCYDIAAYIMDWCRDTNHSPQVIILHNSTGRSMQTYFVFPWITTLCQYQVKIGTILQPWMSSVVRILFSKQYFRD